MLSRYFKFLWHNKNDKTDQLFFSATKQGLLAIISLPIMDVLSICNWNGTNKMILCRAGTVILVQIVDVKFIDCPYGIQRTPL